MRHNCLFKFVIYIAVAFLVLKLVLFIFISVRGMNALPKNRSVVMRIFPFKKHFNVKVHNEKQYIDEDLKKGGNIKYILLWTSPVTVPFVYLGRGRGKFISQSCKYYNCYVTSNVHYLGDVTRFDVVAFHGPEVIHMGPEKLPQKRSPRQKYVFASIESPHYYPICDRIFNGYFNWTWTYKLDSDTRWGYFVVRNEFGDIIGPNKVMHWMKTEDMKPTPKELYSIFLLKTTAAVGFVSNCNTLSLREEFTKELQEELTKYNLQIDIYGECGNLKCDRKEEVLCDKVVEKKYFFYLAFENSFSEDYVTEKVLHGLLYTAIPIVYGGANYTRFMPEGSYINGRELGVVKLAALMNHLIYNLDEYASYFKWRNHYSFHSKSATVETDDYCGICALLNDEKKMNETSVYKNIMNWWNEPNVSECK